LALVALVCASGCAVQSEGSSGAAPADEFEIVGFTFRDHDPSDEEVREMVDEVIEQVLGPDGLAAIIKPGDRVAIKPNNVYSEWDDVHGVITDPRITRYVAEKAREIVGFEGTAEVRIIDTLFMMTANPSPNRIGFGRTRFDRKGDGVLDEDDFYLDADQDGIVDGPSRARLVNTDSIGPWGRYKQSVPMPHLGVVDVYLPKFLRTREQAIAAGEPDEYTDVLIGVPVLKVHWAGITCAIKGHYGIRYGYPFETELTRMSHAGTQPLPGEEGQRWRNSLNPYGLDEYLVAMHVVRGNDFVITDALVGHTGPWNETGRIFMRSLLASRDSVANDTVAALFLGIRPSSIEFLPIGRRYGVGTDEIGWIRPAGLAAFGEQRGRINERWRPEGKYPAPNDYGGIRVMDDFEPPSEVAVSPPMRREGNTFVFIFEAKEGRPNDLGLARVELLVDDELVAFSNTDLDYPGTLEVDLDGLEPGEHSYRIAAWDRALNCAVSESRKLTVEESAAAGATIAAFPINVSPRRLPKIDDPAAMMARLEAITEPPTLVREMIYSEPRDREQRGWIEVPIETSASLAVIASSFEPAEYRWLKDGAEIPGATAASYVIARAGLDDVGTYSCVVRNSAGSVESRTMEVKVKGEPKEEIIVTSSAPVKAQTFAGIEFVKIPAGSFEMGSPDTEPLRQPREGPRHAVTISEPFWIGRFEITKAQWRELMGTEPWQGKPFTVDDPKSPAEYISWHDAQDFIQALNEQGEGSFRLPTEAEWEYAARADSTAAFPFGDDPGEEKVGERAWYLRTAYIPGQRYAHAVGTKPANDWGLHDTMGNAWEWCADWYDAQYYASSPDADPVGPADGSRRVLRGGSWYEDAMGVRSARRHREFPEYQMLGVGFRVCREE
jgi:formylglycine-generating enzyme required for sulfatase activity/uncharacterized protein (DUF362 family)